MRGCSGRADQLASKGPPVACEPCSSPHAGGSLGGPQGPSCAACPCTPAPAGGSLHELAVWDYVCSRPLCALLPRFPALRSLALTGYAIDLGAPRICLRCL